MLAATSALVDAVAHPPFARTLCTLLQRMARNVLNHLCLCLARRELAHALLLVPEGGAESAEPERARATIATTTVSLRDMLVRAHFAAESPSDPQIVMEGLLNQIAAEVAQWAARFDLDYDEEHHLRLSAQERGMYRSLAVPLGRASIVAGGRPPPGAVEAALAATNGPRPRRR